MKEGSIETTWDGDPVEVEYIYFSGDEARSPEAFITGVWIKNEFMRWDGGGEPADQWVKEIIAERAVA